MHIVLAKRIRTLCASIDPLTPAFCLSQIKSVEYAEIEMSVAAFKHNDIDSELCQKRKTQRNKGEAGRYLGVGVSVDVCDASRSALGTKARNFIDNHNRNIAALNNMPGAAR